MVIGVRIPTSSSDAPVDNINLPPEDPRNGNVESSFASDPVQLAIPVDAGISTDDSGSYLPVEISENSTSEEIIKRSSVRALRGILKKPRRFSRDAKIPERQESSHQPKEPVRLDSMADSMVPEVSSQHSDETQTEPSAVRESQPPKIENTDLSSYKIQRGSLQMAAFDRVLFAKRGAELRNEYLREFQ